MATKAVKHRTIKSPGRLDTTLVILRKVNPGPMSVREHAHAPTVMELIGAGYVDQGIQESSLLWFQQGYLLNDQPRSVDITAEIMQNTIGFAVARSDTGEILKEGGPNSLKEMVAAVAGAKIDIGVEIAGDFDDFGDDDGDEAESEE